MHTYSVTARLAHAAGDWPVELPGGQLVVPDRTGALVVRPDRWAARMVFTPRSTHILSIQPHRGAVQLAAGWRRRNAADGSARPLDGVPIEDIARAENDGLHPLRLPSLQHFGTVTADGIEWRPPPGMQPDGPWIEQRLVVLDAGAAPGCRLVQVAVDGQVAQGEVDGVQAAWIVVLLDEAVRLAALGDGLGAARLRAVARLTMGGQIDAGLAGIADSLDLSPGRSAPPRGGVGEQAAFLRSLVERMVARYQGRTLSGAEDLHLFAPADLGSDVRAFGCAGGTAIVIGTDALLCAIVGIRVGGSAIWHVVWRTESELGRVLSWLALRPRVAGTPHDVDGLLLQLPSLERIDETYAGWAADVCAAGAPPPPDGGIAAIHAHVRRAVAQVAGTT